MFQMSHDIFVPRKESVHSSRASVCARAARQSDSGHCHTHVGSYRLTGPQIFFFFPQDKNTEIFLRAFAGACS